MNGINNPWSRPLNRTHASMVCDAACRIDMIRSSTNVNWLSAVINYPHNQKNVTRAAQMRLRKLVSFTAPNDQAHAPATKNL